MDTASTNAGKSKQGSLRGFWALIATQTQGAFNDNLFKGLIVFFLARMYLDSGTPMAEQESTDVVWRATVLFSLPWLLFPGIAGALSDRFSKKYIAIATKYWELAVMAVGIVAFFTSSPMLLWVLLFLMAAQSTFFSPAKYGLLPEILPESRLSWGNGILQMTTFLAIIIGTGLAGYLREEFSDRIYYAAIILVFLSFGGLLSSYGITRPPAANPRQRIPINPWAGLGKNLGVIWRDRWLFLTMLGITYFWFAGVLVLQNLIPLGMLELELTDTRIAMLQASVALGIGLGSVASGYLSRGRIEVGLVPLGAVGMSVVALLLAYPWYGFTGAAVLIGFLGFFAGFYEIPLWAYLQHRSPAEMKGGLIAATNFVTNIGMLLAGGLFFLMTRLHFTPYHVFLVIGVLSLVVGIYICTLLPMFLVRFILWTLTSTLYRVNTKGSENVPQHGGAMLVANHTSFVDALVLSVSIDRPIRFIMSEEIYNKRWIRPIAKTMGAIPISSMSGPRDLLKSLRTATDAIAAGELVCIFAEGQISRTGNMLPFRKGYERIMKNVEAPIIPVHLDRLWGSVFSFSDSKFFWKRPRHIPYPITVSYGEPLPRDADAFTLRQRIRDLGTEAYMDRKSSNYLLHRAFIREARHHPRQLAMSDFISGDLSFFKVLVGSVVFAGKLKPILGGDEMVGVLLPPGVGAALTNVALQIMGKVPVNLNYTIGPEGLASAAAQCKIKHVITARAFLEKLPLEVPGMPVYLEDIRKSVEGKDRIKAMAMAYLLPTRMLERKLGAARHRKPDDLATIIFSSGSEAEPKGVMLTHFNVLGNIDSTLQVFPFDRGDAIMGFVPFFHSLGFMGTLWLPLTQGCIGIYHPSPLEPKAIGQLVYKYKCKYLIATPTFLQSFIRRCEPEEFSSLQYIVTGAEKLPARIREAFKAKFGVEPLEGYGTTECAPVVALNVPDFRAPGYYQRGTKHGTIGQPIPGVNVRIQDPDTGEVLGVNEPGMLHVKGPNIMMGYLQKPELTAEVLKDGWYQTGDIAAIDDEGFITITDRLARFSKIAGEMVPHNKIEETLHLVLALTDQAMAVTGVPDDAKGERLVVLHTLEDEQLRDLLSKLDKSGLPNLWLPRSNCFYRVETIPVLGTGKVDIKMVRQLAKAFDAGE